MQLIVFCITCSTFTFQHEVALLKGILCSSDIWKRKLYTFNEKEGTQERQRRISNTSCSATWQITIQQPLGPWCVKGREKVVRFRKLSFPLSQQKSTSPGNACIKLLFYPKLSQVQVSHLGGMFWVYRSTETYVRKGTWSPPKVWHCVNTVGALPKQICSICRWNYYKCVTRVLACCFICITWSPVTPVCPIHTVCSFFVKLCKLMLPRCALPWGKKKKKKTRRKKEKSPYI